MRWLSPAGLALLVALTGCGSSQRPAPATASPGVLSPLRIEDWSFDGRPGSLIHTRSYRIFTTAGGSVERDSELVADLPVFLERAMDAYTSALGPLPRPPLPLDTFLMADRREWEAMTRRLMGTKADTYLKIERGGFASGGRAVLVPIGPRDTLAIAAHEGWHQYTQRTFLRELPPWLEEGVATYMEGLAPDPASPGRFIPSPWSNPERLARLRAAAARGQTMSLDALLAANPESLIHDDGSDRSLDYYAHVWALTHFLHEGAGGKHAKPLSRMLADAANGRLDRAAASAPADQFRAYFGDPAAAARAYTAFVGALVALGQ